jgi:hypothetical protein
MAIQTGVGTILTYKAESVLGTKPAASSPAAKTVRRVSGIPAVTAAQITSSELRPDRQTASMRQGQRALAASIQGELAITSWDDWMEMAMCGTWTSNVLKVGTTKRSMSLEAGFTDIAKYQTFFGVRIGQMAISIQPNAIATITFDLQGIDADPISGSQYFTSPTAPETTQALTGVGGTLTIGGSPVANTTALDITLNNNLNPPQVIGSRHPPDILLGRATVTGNITALFQDETLVNAFVNETNTAVSMALTDPDSEPDSSLTIALAKARFSAATIEAQGDAGALVRITYTALIDATAATSLSITRVVGTYS